jgi:nicotinamide-nucleotide amidase
VLAEIVTIGDELTRGEIVDTNSSWLAARLWDLGVEVRWMTSCRDDADDMRGALAAASRRAQLVLVSGGLGPTEDDLTVHVVADLIGVAPAIEPPARAVLERVMAGRGRAVSAVNLRQVRIPAGARVYANPAGLAPGFEVALGGVPVVCLPGVPREVYGIFDGGVAARVAALRAAGGEVVERARQIYRVFAAPSRSCPRRARLVDDVAGASIHYQVKFPETLVKLVVADRDAARAAALAFDAALRAGSAGGSTASATRRCRR